MAEQVGPAQGKPITSLAFKAAFQRLASLRADSIMARSHSAPSKRPKIRLQSVLPPTPRYQALNNVL